MKAYSLDLRQKIIEVYKQGELSQRQLALHFRVTLGFISKLLKQYRETGEMGAKIRTQQTPTKLNPEHLGILTRLVESQNDATLDELRQTLHDRTGVLISRSTTCRMLQRLHLNRKKKPSTLPRKRATEFSSNE